MHGTRADQDLGSPTGMVGARSHEPGLDDWLGDVSDDDWSEGAASRSGYGAPGGAGTRAVLPAADPWLETATDPTEQIRPVSKADARRAAIERRRYTAGFVLLVAVGLAVAIPVILLRGGNTTEATSGDAVTATTPTETGQSTVTTTTTTTPSAAGTPDTTTSPTTPSTTPTTTAPTTTTPTTTGATGFTLPEGTKLQLGENDPALVRELQQALITAGYDPGPADGTYGSQTEAAVVAFQQANGLSVDGRVGPETASALNAALATG